MATKLAYIGVAVLAIIAVILGYKIYQQQVGIISQTIPSPSQQIQNSPTPRPLVNQATPEAEQILQPQLPSTEERTLAKNVPPQGSTLEERVEFNKKLAAFEKETDLIQITSCTPYPFIAKVKENSTLQIKNDDYVERLIFIGQDQLRVSARSTISTQTGKGDGVTNLTCNRGMQGLLHTVQVQ